jgi:hypothetical protein
MSLMPYVRQHVVALLWQRYLQECLQAQRIAQVFAASPLVLDHFAIIDLPSQHTGIATLNQIFAAIDFLPQGRDYLADKQNEFMWLASADAEMQAATAVLPQIVIADFDLAKVPNKISDIIMQYANQAPAFPWREFHQQCGKVYHDDQMIADQLIQLIVSYCFQRDWQMPSAEDYRAVKTYNELLAWVLLHGRKINHFGLAIHHLKKFPDLTAFNYFIVNDLSIPLNQQGGIVKGTPEKGITQSSTESENDQPFIEFVWRFSNKESPWYWKDYFTGFIGNQANYVIESICSQE